MTPPRGWILAGVRTPFVKAGSVFKRVPSYELGRVAAAEVIHGRGNWQLPGGFIEPHETIEQAVIREVQEEAGVIAEVEGVLGLRNRYDPESGNGLYVVLLLRPCGGPPRAGGREVDHAEFFALDQIRQLSPLPPVNWEIAQRVLAADRRLLFPKPLTNLNGAPFTLFVG